jgi:hypothetical protein
MKQMSFNFPIPDGYQVIFRATKTLKNGKVIHASQFGKRAFPMLVPIKKT